ncbi:ABC transporter ATP-binding protein [Altererythrobacter sp. ZODW24]|uniref:ABC transporter ATP-binding protein n=1 Tax=Altererythrobacter sp. ZODW24 TaxID=2185142 RepID=UPI000DF85BAA|nr:ABC transporter ATP-binding protein [Altererythrobacter sp. ZODW24]
MILEAKDLTVQLGSQAVLHSINAPLQPGSVTAICGPNGAGKSTLLSALAGLVDAESGAVLLDGKNVGETHPRTRAQTIGYLPQSGEVAWDVSVRSLVALGRMPHGDSDPVPVENAIAALDLQEFANRPMSQLSGGEKARALLARVLAGEPDWILADEPLAALDLAHQLSILRHLRKAADEGAGVVLVLHDLALAMNHADRVLVLDEGALVADAPPVKALSEATIAKVWGVAANWLGEDGAKALVAR